MTCFTAVFDLLQRSGTEPVISLRSACTLQSRLGNSLEVQGIRVNTSNAGGAGSVPHRGTNIPHARLLCLQRLLRVVIEPEGVEDGVLGRICKPGLLSPAARILCTLAS